MYNIGDKIYVWLGDVSFKVMLCGDLTKQYTSIQRRQFSTVPANTCHISTYADTKTM